MKLDIMIKDANQEDLCGIASLFYGSDIPVKTTPTLKKRARVFVTGHKIPFKCGTKEYQRALRLCKKYGDIPYMDALRESGAFQVDEPPQNNGLEPHWREVIKKSVTPTHEPRVIE